jgi:hypothetical protein
MSLPLWNPNVRALEVASAFCRGLIEVPRWGQTITIRHYREVTF